MADLVALGNLVREGRELKRMTQADLGKHLSISRASIGLLESGGTKYPRIDQLTAIADILDIPPSALYQLAGITLAPAAPAQLSWLASQLDEEGIEILIELGHALLRARLRRGESTA